MEERMHGRLRVLRLQYHFQTLGGIITAEGQEGAGQLNGQTTQRSLTVEDILPPQRTADNVLPVAESSAVEGKDTRVHRKKKKGRSLFPLSANMDNRAKCHLQQDCLTLARLMYDRAGGDMSAGSAGCDGLGLFFDRRSLYKTFREESLNHVENGHLDHSLQLAVWRGDIVGALQLARQHGQLSDWLVAMAPLAGHDIWLQTVQDYAQQLCGQDQHYKAVTFLLACHKVHQAIALLKNNKMFREAVALAKARLPPHDPVILDLYEAWATELQKDHYEQAAKCYLAMQQPCDAVAVLARRGDLDSLRVAASVAAAAGSEDQLTSVACRYAHECQLQCKWLEGQELLKNHKQLQVHRLTLCLHEVLVGGLSELGCLSADQAQMTGPYSWGELGRPVSLPDILQYRSEVDPLCPWPPYLVQGELFLGYVVQVWCQYCGLVLTTDNILQLCQQLTATVTAATNPGSTAKLLSVVSCQLTTGLLYLVAGEVQKAGTHFIAAVHLTHDRGQYHIMKGLLQMILPQGLLFLRKLEQMSTAQECLKSEVKLQDNSTTPKDVLSCLSAFYHVATLYDLWWNGPHNAVSIDHNGGGATVHPQSGSNDGSSTVTAAVPALPQQEEGLPENSKSAVTNQRVSVLIQQLQAISAAVLIPDIARKYALEEQLAQLETALHTAAAHHRQSRLLNTVQTDGNNTCSTVETDANNTCSTVETDANNTCSTVETDANNTCSTVETDANNTCSTVETDANNTCSTVETDANNTCSTVQTDANNTCSIVQTDANYTCSEVQTDANTCSTVQTDANNTCSTVQTTDANNTCSIVQTDANSTCSKVQTDAKTCSTVQTDANNTCSIVQTDANSTCSKVQTDAKTCSTVQTDAKNSFTKSGEVCQDRSSDLSNKGRAYTVVPHDETERKSESVLSTSRIESKVVLCHDHPEMFAAGNNDGKVDEDVVKMSGGPLQTDTSQKDKAAGEELTNRGRCTLDDNSQMMAGWGVQLLETCQDVLQGGQLSQVQEQLSAIPQEYRTLPFPEPVELAMTLVYLCCHWPHHRDMMAAVGHDVISWGLQHSWKSSQHQFFNRWRNKMSS
ncbi:Gem-associated protein 5 [Branchiostoma belcheri]|nr:Gem-associated protein 5 [Branchiostoma belcheri]